MTKLKVVLWIVAVSQLALGALTLLAPGAFFVWMGLTRPPADNGYMIGMLAARFLAYGIGMVALARARDPEPFWIRNMVFVQAVDFAVGLGYVAAGVVAPGVAAFPMVNAALFASLLWLWRPSAVRTIEPRAA